MRKGTRMTEEQAGQARTWLKTGIRLKSLLGRLLACPQRFPEPRLGLSSLDLGRLPVVTWGYRPLHWFGTL